MFQMFSCSKLRWFFSAVLSRDKGHRPFWEGFFLLPAAGTVGAAMLVEPKSLLLCSFNMMEKFMIWKSCSLLQQDVRHLLSTGSWAISDNLGQVCHTGVSVGLCASWLSVSFHCFPAVGLLWFYNSGLSQRFHVGVHQWNKTDCLWHPSCFQSTEY